MRRTSFVIVTALLLTAGTLSAQVFHATSIARRPASSVPEWMTESWTGNSQHYQRIETEVKQAIKESLNPVALVAQYKSSAQQDVSNPIPMFRWAYAAYCLSFTNSSFKASGEVTQAGMGLRNSVSPHTYEFARLRFILEASAGGFTYPLKPIGERLLHRDRKDTVVKFWLIRVLDDGSPDADKQEALTYARELISSAPQKPYGYDLLGWTYFVIQMKSHKVSDGDKAVVAYRQAQQYAPDNPEFCAGVERLIRLIHTSQANIAKKHNGT